MSIQVHVALLMYRFYCLVFCPAANPCSLLLFQPIYYTSSYTLSLGLCRLPLRSHKPMFPNRLSVLVYWRPRVSALDGPKTVLARLNTKEQGNTLEDVKSSRH